MVDALTELGFPFPLVKGGNAAFIAAIASGLCPKDNDR